MKVLHVSARRGLVKIYVSTRLSENIECIGEERKGENIKNLSVRLYKNTACIGEI